MRSLPTVSTCCDPARWRCCRGSRRSDRGSTRPWGPGPAPSTPLSTCRRGRCRRRGRRRARTERVVVPAVGLPGRTRNADRHERMRGGVRVVTDRELVLILGGARARESGAAEDRQRDEHRGRNHHRGRNAYSVRPRVHHFPPSGEDRFTKRLAASTAPRQRPGGCAGREAVPPASHVNTPSTLNSYPRIFDAFSGCKTSTVAARGGAGPIPLKGLKWATFRRRSGPIWTTSPLSLYFFPSYSPF